MSQKSGNGNSKSKLNHSFVSWIIIGIGVGIAVGTALNSISIGIAIGVGIGVLLGSAASRRTDQ